MDYWHSAPKKVQRAVFEKFKDPNFLKSCDLYDRGKALAKCISINWPSGPRPPDSSKPFRSLLQALDPEKQDPGSALVKPDFARDQLVLCDFIGQSEEVQAEVLRLVLEGNAGGEFAGVAREARVGWFSDQMSLVASKLSAAQASDRCVFLCCLLLKIESQGGRGVGVERFAEL